MKEVKKEKGTPFYKKAVFPWAIIVVAVVFFSGVMLGWTMRSEDVARMDSVRATALAEVSKTPEQK